jgi:hypothetical protein
MIVVGLAFNRDTAPFWLAAYRAKNIVRVVLSPKGRAVFREAPSEVLAAVWRYLRTGSCV